MKKFKILKRLKFNNGVTGIDISIAIVVISVFTGVIANLIYQNYKTSLDIQKSSNADAYATIIMEKVDEKSFEEVSDSNFVNTLKSNNEIKIDSNYDINYTVSDYTNHTINNNPVFKKITVVITFDNGKKTLTIDKLKVREI